MEEHLIGGLIAAVALLAAGILIVWMGIRGARRRLPRNYLVGIRTASTLASDAAWIEGHAAAAIPVMVGGVGPVVAGIALLFPGMATVGVAMGGCFWAVAWLILATVIATHAAKRVDGTV